MNENLKKKIKEVFLAGVYGDVLGVPYEFLNRESVKNKFVGLTCWGTYNQPKGTWSDDTSMTLATLDWLTVSKNNYKLLMENFLDWLYERNFKYINSKNVFDVGIQTREKLNLYKNSREIQILEDPFYNNGNGSLMRIAPISLLFNSPQEIFNVSELTHSHHISKLSCLIFSIILKNIIFKNVSLPTALEISHKAYLEYLEEEIEDYKERLEVIEGISLIFEKNEISGRFVLEECSEDYIQSSGYVVHSLMAAIWSSFQSKNTLKNIETAVKLGEDTDTIGSLTGQLSAALYGFDEKYSEDILEYKTKFEPILNKYIEIYF